MNTGSYIEECYAQIEEGGGTRITPDDKFYAEIDKAAEGVQNNYISSNPDFKDLYDKVVQYVEENTK